MWLKLNVSLFMTQTMPYSGRPRYHRGYNFTVNGLIMVTVHNCITGVKPKTITKNTTYFISGSQTKVQSHQLRLWYTVGKSGPCRDDGPALLSPAPPQHPRQLSQHRDIRGDTGKLTQQFLTCHQSNSRSYVIYFNIRAFCCHSF